MTAASLDAIARSAERVARIDRVLAETQGHPRVVPGGDPLNVLIETILSQSTSDTNRERAYASLRERFPTWQEALDAGPEAIEDAIRSGGLARQKSARIHDLLARLKRERGALDLSGLCASTDEAAFGYLRTFDGVGTKTIAIILMFVCGRDLCAVDTHVLRLCRRLGIVDPRTGADRAYEELQPLIPEGHAAGLHINLIRFGRERCTARNPLCDGCPLHDVCRYDPVTGTTERVENE